MLRWREKFRKGEFGIGGDLKYVQDGVGELRVVEIPKLPSSASETDEASTSHLPNMQKLVINVPSGSAELPLKPGQSTQDLKKPAGVKLLRGHAIVGSYIQPVAGTNGSVAKLKVVEGMWEHRRGHKVDGGERRKAEVRFKRGVEERKKARS